MSGNSDNLIPAEALYKEINPIVPKLFGNERMR